MNSESIDLHAIIPEHLTGIRLDQALAKIFSEYSRSQLQSWISQGVVLLDGKPCLISKTKIHAQQSVTIKTTIVPIGKWLPEELPLNIVFEDEHLLVVNKPVGMVVHPGAGVHHATLVNALLHYAPELDLLPRAGLIHRLDKGTSGLLIVARNLISFNYLTKQMRKRLIQREYEAIVKGVMISGGTIDVPIGRDHHERTRMSIMTSGGGREAITHYRVIKRFNNHTHVRVTLETGRTHQIRVHLAHIHHPLIGDRTYDRTFAFLKAFSEPLKKCLAHFKHPALHATQVSLRHPVTRKNMSWEAPLPEDMQELLQVLQTDSKI